MANLRRSCLQRGGQGNVHLGDGEHKESLLDKAKAMLHGEKKEEKQ